MSEMSTALEAIFRWMHVFVGIIWIGLLYFFNWVNGPFVAKLDGGTKYRVKEIGLDNDLGRLTKLVPMSKEERGRVLTGVNSPEEFDAKVKKKKQGKSERQKSTEDFAAFLIEHIPPDLFPKVDDFLKAEGARVLLSAFRKAKRATE